MRTQQTHSTKAKDVERKWVLVDAKDQILGRLSTQIAHQLRGKNKPTFTPHVDCGNMVVVVNAEKIKLTGNKWKEKIYYRHSGWVGGLKSSSALDIKNKFPERLIMTAVRGMLPKNNLSRRILKKLKVYKGAEHPHQAHNPEPLKLKE